MHRFAPALRRAARELDLPASARTRILQEMAADLDAVYAHHRARGVEEAEAQQRAEESVLGNADVVRRLARLHRHSWRVWSESMANRLSGGVDLLMLLLGVGPVLAAAAVLSVRTAAGSGGTLAWVTSAVSIVIVVALCVSIMRAARHRDVSSALLESLAVAGTAAFALGVLAVAFGLHATSAALASGPLTPPDAAALSARVMQYGTLAAVGLLLAIAALFAWFLLLGRQAERLALEVDALLGGADLPEPRPTVIPLNPGRSA